MVFVLGALVNGCRLRSLTIDDDFTHESVGVAVDHGIGGTYVAWVLDQAARVRGYP